MSFTVKKLDTLRILQLASHEAKIVGRTLNNYLKDKKIIAGTEVIVYALEDDGEVVATVERHHQDDGYKTFNITGPDNEPPAPEHREFIEAWLDIESDLKYYFLHAVPLHDDYKMVMISNHKLGIINKDMKFVIQPEYTLADTVYSPRVGVQTGWSMKKEDVRLYDSAGEIHIAVRKNGYALERPVVVRLKYDFTDGFAYRKSNGGIKIINLQGKESKSYATVFKDGEHFIVGDKKFGVIDSKFKEITPVKYDEVHIHDGTIYADDKQIKISA